MDLSKKSTIRKIVVGTFISVPILSSIISTIHLISLFDLGNYSWMSLIISAAFELGSIAAFLIPAVLKDIKRGMVYTIFAILALMQVVGNVFFSYDFVFNKLKIDRSYLDSFLAFLSNFGSFDLSQVMLWLAIIIGAPIPLLSLFFLKSWIDYLKLDKEEKLESIIDTPKEIVSDIMPVPFSIKDPEKIPENIVIDPVDDITSEIVEEPYIEETPEISPAVSQNNNLK